MADEKKSSVFIDNMLVLASPDGMQKYLFGTKKNGCPRAVYDIVKDYTKPKKKKGKKKKGKVQPTSSYGFYLEYKGKKKKKKSKHWRFD